LSGEVRPVSHSEARLKEAARLGFGESWMPRRDRGRPDARGGPAKVGIAHLHDLVALLSPKRVPVRRDRIGIAS
jgi:DNA repair protein RadA/Sms